MVTAIRILASNLFSTHPLNRVPHKPIVTKAPLNTTSTIGPTSRRGRITIILGPTNSFPRRHPLNLQTRFRPPVNGNTGVKVNKTGVSATARVSNTNHVRVTRPAGAVGAAEGASLARSGGGGGVDVTVACAGGGAVERRQKKGGGAVEVNDGVGASDVEREGGVELDTLVDFIGGDACVGDEG